MSTIKFLESLRNSKKVSTFRGDLIGGSTGSFLALPESMAYGTIVFAPLGPDYVAAGLIAGMLALVFSNLVPFPSGGIRIMSNGPYSLASLMLASAVALFVGRASQANLSHEEVAAVCITLLFLVVFMAGVFQVCFGILKLGDLAKYIPLPVVAGLLNGTSITLFLKQLQPMLGLPDNFEFDNLIVEVVAKVQPFTFIIGMVTVLTIWFGPKITKRIPAPFLGIGAGTAGYYILHWIGKSNSLGPLIGWVNPGCPVGKVECDSSPHLIDLIWNNMPILDIWEFPRVLATSSGGGVLETITSVIPLAIGIALIVSLRTLIVSVATDNVTGERSDTNRELVIQGSGNMLSSLFGGITSAGSQSRSLANYNFGGRTSFSRVVAGVFGLVVLLVLGPYVALIPKVVLAGTLMVLAIKAFDIWSLSLIPKLFGHGTRKTELVSDLLVVAVVTGVILGPGIFWAVAVGIGASLIILVHRMGRGIIRREYTAERVRSNVDRSQIEIDTLEEHGYRIIVMELEGSLFFGTADKLAASVEANMAKSGDYIILDLHRVTDIDSTGINILLQINDRAFKQEKSVFLSVPKLVDSTSAGIIPADVLEIFGRQTCFESIDDSLASAEDGLLDHYLGFNRYERELDLSEISVFGELTLVDREVLEGYLSRERYQDNDVIFSQGDSAQHIFVLVKGRVDITVRLSQEGEVQRIATLCPGTLFGEMAILDGRPRSANVVSHGDTVCYTMSNENFLLVNSEHPSIAYKFLAVIGQELSKRIRIANRIATELKV